MSRFARFAADPNDPIAQLQAMFQQLLSESQQYAAQNQNEHNAFNSKISKLTDSFNKLTKQVGGDITALKAQVAQLTQMVNQIAQIGYSPMPAGRGRDVGLPQHALAPQNLVVVSPGNGGDTGSPDDDVVPGPIAQDDDTDASQLSAWYSGGE